MIPQGPLPVNGTGFTSNEAEGGAEDELARVLDAYLAEVEAGRPVDPEEWVERHPAIAERLRACLRSLHLVEAAAEALAVAPEPAHGVGSLEWVVGSEVSQPLQSLSDLPTPHSPLSTDSDGPTLGDFRIIRELGRGGMGVVYEAEQHSLGRRVALKVLPFAAAIDPRQIARFRVEAQAASHLNHPHIVPVYSVGCQHGVHYYAMQLINGPTLAERIDELRGRDRSEALPDSQPEPGSTASIPNPEVTPAHPEVPAPVEAPPASGPLSAISARHRASAFFQESARLGFQAAEALEHAHQQGVLHRDIKPSNLIVDGRGHLWVTDFGLARFLGVGEASLTATGDMLGTLRYMSPEQALANHAVVDQRTDVYSLGATLYELMTLRPAIEGTDRQELLRKLAQEDPRRPSLLNPSVPRDLETIIIKAMAKDPAGRYATAQDLADDFGRFLDDRPILARRPSLLERSSRWARRHLAALVVAVSLLVLGLAAGIVVVLVKNGEILREHQENIRARDEALKQGGVARRAVKEMYSKVAEEWLGQQPALQPVQREFLQKALEYYQAFSLEQDPDPAVRADAGEAALRVGEIQRKLGNNDESEHAYRRAIVTLESIPAGALDGRSEPDGSSSADVVQEYLSTSYSRLGQLLIDTGRSEEAARTLRHAAELTRAMVTGIADSPVNRPLLASAYHRLGLLLRETGQPREAEAAYRKAVELALQIDGLRGLKIQMGAHVNLGILLSLAGRRHEAEQAYREAIKFHEALVNRDPNAHLYRYELAKTLLGLGPLLKTKGDGRPEAEQVLRRALGLYERLTAEAPGVLEYQHGLAATLLNLSSALQFAGQFREAESLCGRSVELYETLVRQSPADPSVRIKLAVALALLAELMRFTDRPAAAMAHVRRAQDLFDTIANDDPDVPLERVKNQVRLGHIVELTGQVGEATPFYRRAVAMADALAADHPDRLEIRDCLADSLMELAKSCGDAPDEAERSYRRALTLVEPILSGQPELDDRHHIVARLNHGLGLLLAQTGRASEAERVLRRALELYELPASGSVSVVARGQGRGSAALNLAALLAKSHRLNEAERLTLGALETFDRLSAEGARNSSILESTARCLSNLATIYVGKKQLEDAERSLRRAADVLDAMDPSAAGRPETRNLLGSIWIGLGTVLRMTGRTGEAEPNFHRAVPVYERLVADQPGHAEYRAALAQARFSLGSLLAAQRDWVAAAQIFRQAIASHEEARRLSPLDSTIPQGLRILREALIGVLLRLGAHAEIATVAEDWLREPAIAGPRISTLAASYLTSCAALAAQDPKLPRDAREAAARSYARRARDLIHQAARLRGDPGVPYHLAWFLVSCPVAELRDPTEAIRITQDILKRAPNSWLAWATLGAAHYRADNPRDAIVALERAAGLNHGNLLYYGYILAMAQHRLDHKGQARACFDNTDRWRQAQPWDEVVERLRAEAGELIKAPARAAPTPEEWRKILPFVH